jgi:hypothetical protein
MSSIGKFFLSLAVVSLLVFTVACEPVEEKVTTAPGLTAEQGTIEIRVTDPPPPGVYSANVTLTKVEVHMASDNVSGNESGWTKIFEVEDGVTFDLFEVIEKPCVLGSDNVTAGKYTQIRVYVQGVEGLTKDMEPYKADVPNGILKFVRSFDVEDGVTTILTLDFDGDKSLVMTGKEGKFLFKPVVKLLIEYE